MFQANAITKRKKEKKKEHITFDMSAKFEDVWINMLGMTSF